MIAAQVRLLDVPLVELSVASVREANELLAAWGHRLGPIHRPTRCCWLYRYERALAGDEGEGGDALTKA